MRESYILAILVFAVAIATSVVAEWYSVAGMAVTFATPGIVLGVVIGSGKLVCVSWLYRNWSTAHTSIKVYFTIAVMVMSALTSLGVFGYLSQTHMNTKLELYISEQRVGQLNASIAEIDKKLATAAKQRDMIDLAVTKLIENDRVTKALAAKQQAASEMDTLSKTIDVLGSQQQQLVAERDSVSIRVEELKTNLGPAKFLSAMLYGSDSIDRIDDAVMLMTIAIVVILDPFAILMVIAGNITLSQISKSTSDKNDVISESYEQKPRNKRTRGSRGSVVMPSTNDGIDWESFAVDRIDPKKVASL